MSLVLSFALLWLGGALAIIAAVGIMQGADHPMYGYPVAVFLWMGLSWLIHSQFLSKIP